jgi:type IV secretion system protein VirB5
MLFRRTLQRYGRTPQPVTPYQRAAQVWDERIGSARVQAANWRLMAFGCLALSVGLSAGLIWQSSRSRITPYVVEVDRLGEVRAVAPAIETYQPTDAQIAWYLGRFITDVRSLSIDPVLVRRNWLEAYDLANGHAALFLNDFARTNDPFTAIGDRSVSVEVTSVVRASDKSFQVKWTERIYRQGSLSATERWTAILATVIRTPRTAEALRKDPLGLYVTDIAWSRELDTGANPH